MQRPSLVVLYLAIGASALLAMNGCGGDAQTGGAGGASAGAGTGGDLGGAGAGGGTGGTSGAAAGAGTGGATAGAGGGQAGTSGGAAGTNATGGRGGGGGGTAGAGGGAGPTLTGLHVDGNAIKNGQGQVVRLHGVNRSGTEYRCIAANSTTIFDGAFDDASISVIASWNVNAVRVPLNEDCWLAINGAPATTSGANYKNAIKTYVGLLEQHNMAPILELHWAAPGTTAATRQQPMPDADHAVAFWTDVAQTFAGDSRVIFEPYNEPFPDSNRDSTAAWTCWRDGCTANLLNASGMTSGTYMATGFQALVNAIRGTGAPSLILLGGVQYSNTLTNWQTYKPTDAMNNLAPAWHVYNFNGCAATTCWNGAPATLAAGFPIVATEFGENDCQGGTFLTSLLTWLDQKNQSYLAWTWDTWGTCTAGGATGNPAGNPWALTTSYTTGTPNSAYATAVHNHFVGL